MHDATSGQWPAMVIVLRRSCGVLQMLIQPPPEDRANPLWSPVFQWVSPRNALDSTHMCAHVDLAGASLITQRKNLVQDLPAHYASDPPV